MSALHPVTILLIVMVLVLVALVVVLASRTTTRRIANRYEQLARQVSDRLHFRQPNQADRSFYEEMANDPVAARNNGWSAEETTWVKRRFTDPTLFAQLQLSEIVAVERSTGRRVGTATFSQSPFDEAARAIGIHVHPDHARQGYGTEIMAGAILMLQESPGPIHVGTLTINVGMQQIMTKLGFTREPSTRPYKAPDGQTYESYWYRCELDSPRLTGARHEHPPHDQG